LKRVTLLALIFVLAVGVSFAESPKAETGLGPSGGLGLGYTGILTSEGWLSLAILDLRLGGYFQYNFARLGPGALGAEIGAWAFVLPSENRWLMLSELPLSLDYQLTLGHGWDLTAQLGYALFFGSADDLGLYHCQVTGLRVSSGHFFCALAAYIPFAASGGYALTSITVWPHAEIGYRF
jgi:hypothetical protein